MEILRQLGVLGHLVGGFTPNPLGNSIPELDVLLSYFVVQPKNPRKNLLFTTSFSKIWANFIATNPRSVGKTPYMVGV